MVDLSKIKKVDLSGIKKVKLPTSNQSNPMTSNQNIGVSNQPILGNIKAGGVEVFNPAAQKVKNQLNTDGQVLTKQTLKNIDQEETQGLLNNLTVGNKSLNDVSVDDLVKASNGNLDFAKSVMGLINGFKSQNGNDKNKKLDVATAALQEMINLTKNIPAQSGLYGKTIQPAVNKTNQVVGSLPEKEIYEGFIPLVTPLLLKGLGDAGNLGDQEKKQIAESISLLANPQIEVRKQSRDVLAKILTRATGKKVMFTAPNAEKKQKTDLSSFSDEELIKMLGE